MSDPRFAPLTAALEEALESGLIPSVALGVRTQDGLRFAAHLGLAQRVPEAEALTPDHRFDLASLTKVLLTTPAILALAAEGRLDLDDPLSTHLPDLHQYDPNHRVRSVTLRQCLTHTSGLPAVEPIYTWGEGADRLTALILQKDWAFGENVYSDINFMLLGVIIERLTGQSLTHLAEAAGFCISPGPTLAVATERCAWRNRVIKGEVHDENAYALGGIAGHAGLFGTLDAVLDRAEALAFGTVLPTAARTAMLEKQTDTRSLGWQIRHPNWSGGGLCSARSIGHTGFTGTGVWIDPERGLTWALLANRVHPTRHTEVRKFHQFRQRIGNLVQAVCA
ncbi:MAG: serine hydrolase domain-containing protein [Elstera sp.]